MEKDVGGMGDKGGDGDNSKIKFQNAKCKVEEKTRLSDYAKPCHPDAFLEGEFSGFF
jgi:hypothetical protein